MYVFDGTQFGYVPDRQIYDSTAVYELAGSGTETAGYALGAAPAPAPFTHDVLVVGAPDSNLGIGRVYVSEVLPSPGTYSLDDSVVNYSIIDGTAGDGFGHSLAGVGLVFGGGDEDNLVVAAHGYGTDPDWYLFEAITTLLPSTTDAAAIATFDSDQNLSSSGADPERAVVGVGDVDGDLLADFALGDGLAGIGGSAYLFYGGSFGGAYDVSAMADERFHLSSGTGDALGSALTAGDYNADARADLVALARDPQSVHLFYGPYDSLADNVEAVDANATLKGGTRFSTAGLLGYRVARLGDVNADGVPDVGVSAPTAASGKGQAFVHFGPTAESDPLHWQQTVTRPLVGGSNIDYTGEHSGDLAGYEFAVGAGDLDGDGYDDLLLSASTFTWSTSDSIDDEGAVYLFYGPLVDGSINLASSTDAPVRFRGDDDNGQLGNGINGIGDFDGDGVDDFALGAPFDDRDHAGTIAGSTDRVGAVYLMDGGTRYSGRNLMAEDEARCIYTGSNPTDWVGWAIGNEGDVDGDGYADLIVGAPGFSYNKSDQGAVFVVHGHAGTCRPDGGFPAVIAHDIVDVATDMIVGEAADDGYGWDVESVNDLDGDGADEILVGAPDADSAYWVPLPQAWSGSTSPPQGPGNTGTTLCSGGRSVSSGEMLLGYLGDVLGGGPAARRIDIAVGDPYKHVGFPPTEPGNERGIVRVYDGATVLSYAGGIGCPKPTTSLVGSTDGERLGWSVGLVGDLNQDGEEDLMAGAPNHAWGGAAYFLLSSYRD